MSKNILVISASLRNGSNSDMLADEFMRGALESGNKAEKITLRGKSINFCKGCLACQKTGKCVINDDMAEILPKMQHADVICFASPVYFFEDAGLKGVVCGLGAKKAGDVKSMPAMNEAYMLGKQA